jgi:hypothetical protein
MTKKILIALLTISLLIEALLCFLCFFMPEVAFKQMGLAFIFLTVLPQTYLPTL